MREPRLQAMLERVGLDAAELDFRPIRAQGSGGQHLNKVSSAVHLRFDIRASSLPSDVKSRLLALPDRRISTQGIVVIKAQAHRQLERNREAALRRLIELVQRAGRRPVTRRPTGPSRSARRQRLERKTRRGRLKRLRARPDFHD